AAAVGVAVVALAVSTLLTWRANQDLHQALNRERDTLERERQDAYYQRIALAEREWAANNLSRMQQLLEECPEELRGWEWHYLNRLRYKNLPPLHHDAAVLCAVFSPDGRRIASSDQDGWVKVWDAQTGHERLKFRAHEDHARSVAFSPDGRRLATASYDGTVKTWDAQTGQELPVAKHHDGPVRGAQFSPDGRYLASALVTASAQGVYVWDAATGDDVRMLGGLRVHSGGVHGIAFSPDGRRLAASCAPPIGGSGVVLTVWDLQTGRKQLTICQDHAAFAIAFSADGRFLAAAMGAISNQPAAE